MGNSFSCRRVLNTVTKTIPSIGERAICANDTVYLASTDGFVTTYGGGSVIVYSDTSASPSTSIVCRTGVSSGHPLVVPIIRNQYWKVTGANYVAWEPFV